MESPIVFGNQSDSKIVCNTTIHARFSSNNIQLNGSNHHICSKSLEMHIADWEKNDTLQGESCSKRRWSIFW